MTEDSIITHLRKKFNKKNATNKDIYHLIYDTLIRVLRTTKPQFNDFKKAYCFLKHLFLNQRNCGFKVRTKDTFLKIKNNLFKIVYITSLI